METTHVSVLVSVRDAVMNKGFGEEHSGFRSDSGEDASDSTRARLRLGPGGRV
jgi:hypothetical protein